MPIIRMYGKTVLWFFETMNGQALRYQHLGDAAVHFPLSPWLPAASQRLWEVFAPKSEHVFFCPHVY